LRLNFSPPKCIETVWRRAVCAILQAPYSCLHGVGAGKKKGGRETEGTMEVRMGTPY